MEPSFKLSETHQSSYTSRPHRHGTRYEPRRGLSIPAITALDSSGRVIEEEQRSVFQFIAQRGLGADIIFGGGTTGEWNRITNVERQRLIRIEADEILRINEQAARRGLAAIEAWAGVTAETRAETLANLECAIEAGVDAAVIAPLSIRDGGDIITFFQRDVSDLFDHTGRWLPIFLYDNADIAANPRSPHIRTRDVKRLSRLPFIFGLKVSAPRRVLGNYTKGAGHFKDKGEFGIYVGDAMLMFQVFKMEDGFIGRVREYWNRYLLHNELPVGVVSGPANAMPREWQRAWRACYAGDERLMPAYRSAFDEFSAACRFTNNGKIVEKTIACVKYALKLDGVITSDEVAKGTCALNDEERRQFAISYRIIKDGLAAKTDNIWISKKT
jgi:dihydrodipicolinate synthase/N-acetylneuraminate lyase